MGVIGRPRVQHQKWKFLVEIDGLGSAFWQSCSELSKEVAVIEYYEGAAIIPDKQPGRMKVSDMTLERGATVDRNLYDWFNQVADAARNGGLQSPQFKRNGSIAQLERDDSIVRRWTIVNVWPNKFMAGSWDNNADEVVLESVTLVIDDFYLKKNVG